MIGGALSFRFGRPTSGVGLSKCNRGAGIRTRDLLLPKQARYRAAPHPVPLGTAEREQSTLRWADFELLGPLLPQPL